MYVYAQEVSGDTDTGLTQLDSILLSDTAAAEVLIREGNGGPIRFTLRLGGAGSVGQTFCRSVRPQTAGAKWYVDAVTLSASGRISCTGK